jgi:hypothetical protein
MTSKEEQVSRSHKRAEFNAMRMVSTQLSRLVVVESADVPSIRLARLVAKKVPIVFRGYGKDFACVRNWEDSREIVRLAREESLLFKHRKYSAFARRDTEDPHLGLTRGKCPPKKVSIWEFLDDARLDYLLGVHGDFTGYSPSQPHPDDQGTLPPFSRSIPCRMPIVEMFGELFGSRFDHQQFFMSKSNVFTDMHFDTYHNFYMCVTGVRKWTLAPPEASQWIQMGGLYSSASEVVPHLNEYGKWPMLESFEFKVVDLQAGDLLYVPPFWWHQVESFPSQVSGLSIAYNYFFSEAPDKVFDSLDRAHSVCAGFYRQALGSLKGSRRTRVSTFAHPETDIVPRERIRGSDSSQSKQQEPTKKRVKWAETEVEYLTNCMPQLMGQWVRILEEGRGIFNECRRPRDLLEKVRTFRRQGILHSIEEH